LCNLYSVTKGQQAIRDFTGAMRDRTGNLPPMPGIFPDYAAPIVRNHSRAEMMARWGMPFPVFALKGKNSDPGVTNAGIRTRWSAVRKVKEGDTTNDIFAFLTTEPNPLIGAIHPKTMRAIFDNARGNRHLDDGSARRSLEASAAVAQRCVDNCRPPEPAC
jgi:putative SOS response-associated peptidase YedK